VVYSSGPWTNSKFEGDVNHVYAKEYTVSRDVYILWEFLKGRHPND